MVYYLYNKPAGVITTADDPRGRRTVLDMVKTKERIFPVGRLDLDTEGVLLLTNDGDLAYRLAHPRFEVEKVYKAWVEGIVNESVIEKLAKGIFVRPGIKMGGEIRILKKRQDQTLIEIRIHEGKKRQIKRMMKAVGHPVIYLCRTCFAGLTTDNLNRGAWRPLQHKEIKILYQKVRLNQIGTNRG